MNIIKYLKGSEFNHSKNFLLSSQLIKKITLFILKNMHFHRKIKINDIFIFSSFRSGSTWLAEILATHKGYKLVNEPLSPYKFEIEKNIAPIKSAQIYFNIESDSKKLLKYFHKLSTGKALLSHRYDILSKSHSFVTNRSIFKLLRATPAIKFLYENIEMKPILLIRHPIASAYSKIESGIFVKDRDFKFIKNDWYIKNFLNNEQVVFAKKVIKKNDDFERGILEWCFDNIPLIKFHEHNKNNSILLTYEELTLYPKQIVEKLSCIYNIDNHEDILSAIYKASAAAGSYSDITTMNMIEKKNDRTYLINKWQKKVTSEQIDNAIKIVNYFNIDIYNDKIIPSEKYLIMRNNYET